MQTITSISSHRNQSTCCSQLLKMKLLIFNLLMDKRKTQKVNRLMFNFKKYKKQPVVHLKQQLNLLCILYLIYTKCLELIYNILSCFLLQIPHCVTWPHFLYSNDKKSQSECNCITCTRFTPHSIFPRIKVFSFLIETTRMQTERMLNFMQLSRLPGKKILQQTTKSQP